MNLFNRARSVPIQGNGKYSDRRIIKKDFTSDQKKVDFDDYYNEHEEKLHNEIDKLKLRVEVLQTELDSQNQLLAAKDALIAAMSDKSDNNVDFLQKIVMKLIEEKPTTKIETVKPSTALESYLARKNSATAGPVKKLP